MISAKIIVTLMLYLDESWWTRVGQCLLAPVAFNAKVQRRLCGAWGLPSVGRGGCPLHAPMFTL